MNAESYWQQSRQAVREKVVETGMQLFLEHGFDATTTTQIAEEVGISSRSLFRYVATKEDLVLGHLEPQGEVGQRGAVGGSGRWRICGPGR